MTGAVTILLAASLLYSRRLGERLRGEASARRRAEERFGQLFEQFVDSL